MIKIFGGNTMITLLILFAKIVWYYWELECFDLYVYKTKTKTYQQAIEDEREIEKKIKKTYLLFCKISVPLLLILLPIWFYVCF